jgi:pimeloyl-ACP methyl ester carboxylesterase
MTTVQSGARTTVNVNGTAVEMFSGGNGPPLVFFHGAGGSSGWQPYHEDLAAEYTVYVPSQPGFNGTEGPGWAKTINDVAQFNHMFIEALSLQNIVLMGSSMGGWVSAEMAAMDDHNIDALILVDAAGIKPVQGQIAEIFMVSADTRLQQRFHDPSQVENYENYVRELSPEEQLVVHSNAITASQLCWRPYLHNPSLPHYLARVDTPTLIVWGREDAIIPVECGHQFQQAINGSQLYIVDNCGHSPAIEKRSEFVSAVTTFLNSV